MGKQSNADCLDPFDLILGLVMAQRRLGHPSKLPEAGLRQGECVPVGSPQSLSGFHYH